MKDSEDKQTDDQATGSQDAEMLSLDDAAQFLGTSATTIYRLLRQGDLKGLKMGRQWRFRKPDLTAYLERSPVAVAAAPSADLESALKFFGDTKNGDAEAKTVRLAHEIVEYAIKSRASDIHMEATRLDGENCFWLRIRCDGVLQEVLRMPPSLQESLTAQFKIMADMNIDEKRVPQDGRIACNTGGKEFDLRVNATPVGTGESVVIRILDRSSVFIGLDKLGLASLDYTQLTDMIHQPNGMVVFTGPTGSGKTTSAYSCLKEVARPEKKTLTIEDPIEYQLPYTTQSQVNKRAGLTFAAGLRSFLRQDPDIVFCGETRDQETAFICVETALTGHLVLSTLHTNGTASAIQRLGDIGIPPYLIVATTLGIVAQRLCRKVCEHCKEAMPQSEAASNLMYLKQLAAEGGYDIPKDAVFVRGRGCEQCGNRGYRGRTGIFEVMVKTPALSEAILRGATEAELTTIAVSEGMYTLLADGVRKAAEGQTTLDEVMRVTFTA